MTPHSSQDDEAYRSDADRAAAVVADPVARLRGDLLATGLLTPADDDELRETIRADVLDAVDRCRLQAPPDPDRARRWLYAGDPPHPGLTKEESVR
jgi:TPP-dependent pyruvate/acetoin dehydrogenase alpha subunit